MPSFHNQLRGLGFCALALTSYLPQTIVTWNQKVFMESDGRRHPGISSIVVVAIPVVVDIREIRRIASIRG